MIIDLILDRKEWDDVGFDAYDAHSFYRECLAYNAVFTGIADGITRAMDYGTNADVQRELCNYVTDNGYNPAICDYINSRDWLGEE